MMPSYHSPGSRCRLPLPSGLRPLRIAWLWIACVAVSTGQEPQQPIRLIKPGEVVVSISIRVTANQPRFVVAARIVEEAVDEAGQKVDAAVNNSSAALEPPPEIVTYFTRTSQQHIAQIDRVCELSQQQKSKLELAAMGDMSRLVRESREMREEHAGKVLRHQHRNLAAFEDVALINTHLSEGVLRDGSMFLMVLRSQLTPEQRSHLAEAKFVELTSAWPFELSDDQRQQLWRLALRIHEHEAPPLLWSIKHCRALVAELPHQELINILGVAKADTLHRGHRR